MAAASLIQEYVLGFAFDSSTENVLLIRKTKPHWQAGKLNGIGGKIESTDASIWRAMSREFQEESGIFTMPLDWRKYAMLEGLNWRVYCFHNKLSDAQFKAARSLTEEIVVVEKSRRLSIDVLPNLKWLVPMALDDLREPKSVIVSHMS